MGPEILHVNKLLADADAGLTTSVSSHGLEEHFSDFFHMSPESRRYFPDFFLSLFMIKCVFPLHHGGGHPLWGDFRQQIPLSGLGSSG